jgi:peptidoglycan/xylan/chitin deacetylase (PgdA/CDA1 family)
MILKRFVKGVAGALCGSRLLAPLVTSRARHLVNVIYYHYIGEPAPHYESFYAGCTLDRFARDLDQLSRVFTFASLADIVAANQLDNSTSRPTIAVTFDDGFDLRRAGVTDVLARYRVPATSFVITSCVGNERLMWRHKLSAIQALAEEATCVAEYNNITTRLALAPIKSASQLMDATREWDMEAKDVLAAELWDRCKLLPESEYLKTYKPYFTWDGLRDWIAAGHSIGFHTHSHPYCSRLEESDLDSELIQPAMDLKTKLGLRGLCLSYPFGDRLSAHLENRLFAQGVFTAFFGISGPSRKGTSNQHLERMQTESDGVSWSVLARSLTTLFTHDGKSVTNNFNERPLSASSSSILNDSII